MHVSWAIQTVLIIFVIFVSQIITCYNHKKSALRN